MPGLEGWGDCGQVGKDTLLLEGNLRPALNVVVFLCSIFLYHMVLVLKCEHFNAEVNKYSKIHEGHRRYSVVMHILCAYKS